MRFRWPQDTVFQRVVLDVEQDCCQSCGRDLHICDHRIRRIYTLENPVELCCRLVHCSDPTCPSRPRTLSPAAELTVALPGWLIGWDVFCFIGHRRFARHWSVPQIRDELSDAYSIKLSPDAISNYIRHYQNMLAARQQDFALLQQAYCDIDSLELSIDGLQPEKGHETLYAVRELRAKRVWFAEALLSSTDAEVQRLLARADEMARRLGKPIRLWMSDKQDAFVKGIAALFTGVPHLYCGNHFLRGLAKPTLEADSTAKVKMRKKVRGLRDIERSVLEGRQQAGAASTAAPPSGAAAARQAATMVAAEVEVKRPVTAAAERPADESKAGHGAGQVKPAAAPPRRRGTAATSSGPSDTAVDQTPRSPAAVSPPEAVDGPASGGTETEAERASGVVLDYCAAVRGILNDDQGGPLDPPGLRMAEALTEVRESLQRCLDMNKPGPAHGQLERLAECVDEGLQEVKAEQQEVRKQVEQIQRVAQTLDPGSGTLEQRKQQYEQLQREYSRNRGEFYERLAKVMLAWAAGLFLKVPGGQVPQDNLDLERWFRNPKGHERRIHGHKHAGVRIVQEGPTLLLTLDAHLEHDRPFTAEDLLPYRHAEAPKDQREAINRRKVMRKARSKKNEEPC
jgi:hypothetical protein